RHAAVQRFPQWSAQIPFLQRANQGAEVSNAGQQQHAGVANTFRRKAWNRCDTEPLQSSCDRCDIARSVVDEGNLHSNPLVLGKTRRSRLSRETAKRSARAKALNTASTR